MIQPIELLAPARDVDVARVAVLHGADAVYIGGPSHGARASVSNSVTDISNFIRFAHLYGVRVYVTLNTIIYENELKAVESEIRQLYDAGVDALIVQDLSLLRMDIPPIDLHASTQCDIRTPEKARFLADCGFSQLVLPRELSLDQIRSIRDAVPADVTLEAFVHGALCVSYSGDCQASCLAKGRSANRGECAQMCRLAYSLTDADGRILIKDKYLLSLRDLNRIDDLDRLVRAGVTSFKIEGRLKDADYVKNTVAAYRNAIDRIIDSSDGRYCRSSLGRSIVSFVPDVNKVFNRGFTSYFIDGRPSVDVSMANIDTPKWVGEEVATVVRVESNAIVAKISKPLNNGDGLGFFDKSGKFTGFHLNRVEGDRLFPAMMPEIAKGAAIYRNRDIKFDSMMSKETAQRSIDVDMALNLDADRLTLTVVAENGVSVTESIAVTCDVAKTPQVDARSRALSKLGSTAFTLRNLIDRVPTGVFIPVSVLTRLRQQAVEVLALEIVKNHHRLTRRHEDLDVASPKTSLTYHDNVANSLAEQVYRDHGVRDIQYALETKPADISDEITVMTTRYCLRRELGACIKSKVGRNLPSPLFLRNDTATYRLDFDCANCQMHLISKRR